MKRVLQLVIYICIGFSLSIAAQGITLKVKNIDIGSTYSDVIRSFGKPKLVSKRGSYPCDDGAMLTVNYSGLKIKLIMDGDNRKFFVASVSVISSKLLVSGVRIGASIKDIQKKFGVTKVIREGNGMERLPYFVRDGYANFYFRKHRLTKISWELNAC